MHSFYTKSTISQVKNHLRLIVNLRKIMVVTKYIRHVQCDAIEENAMREYVQSKAKESRRETV